MTHHEYLGRKNIANIARVKLAKKVLPFVNHVRMHACEEEEEDGGKEDPKNMDPKQTIKETNSTQDTMEATLLGKKTNHNFTITWKAAIHACPSSPYSQPLNSGSPEKLLLARFHSFLQPMN